MADSRRRRVVLLGGGAAVLLVVVVVLVVALSGGKGPISLPRLTAPPVSNADPVPYDGRSPLQAPGSEQRVLVQFSRPALGEIPGARAMGAADQLKHIKSLKRELIATRSALEANGVVLHDVVSFYRVWNGFAATVSTQDVPRLNSPGVHVRTVRRAYPASSEPIPVPGKAEFKAAPLSGQPPVAVLDTGVDGKVLENHVEAGYDAVDRDRDPRPGRDPGGTKREETSGTALAAVVAQSGLSVLPIRIASLRAVAGSVEESTTTDVLIAGLEHAVDPNGDGDTSDHVPVALVGVNAPYAGFNHSPEAEAVEGAGGLGTLVVAPAGNEGPGNSTIGSPGAAPEALAVGALSGSEPVPHAALTLAGEHIADAAVLAGTPPAKGLTAGPVADTRAAVIGRQQTALRGKVVIVKAGANPGAQAAAAAAVGVAAVLLAEPSGKPLPAVPAGRAAAPVIGVTGDAATTLLKAKPGTKVEFGPTERGKSTDAAPAISANTAQGPSAGGRPKPDLAAPGSTFTQGTTGAVEVGGTAIAAARVAVIAANLAQQRPDLTPAQLRAAIIARSAPENLPPERAGAGAVQPGFPAVTAGPPTAVSDPLNPVEIKLTAAQTIAVKLTATGGATAQPPNATLAAGTPTQIGVRLSKPGTTTGRLTVMDAHNATLASVPWLVRPDTVAPVSVGDLRVASNGRRLTFTVGAFDRGPPTQIQVVEKLVLDLVNAQGQPIRSLTFPGGARELMPAEYGYTLAATAKPSTPYAFRVRAWAPEQKTDEPTVKTSQTIKP